MPPRAARLIESGSESGVRFNFGASIQHLSEAEMEAMDRVSKEGMLN